MQLQTIHKKIQIIIKKPPFFIILLLAVLCKAQPTIGHWQEHLPYQNAIQVVQGNKLYCATQYAVFSIDENEELERYTKVTGLSYVGINCIAWDDATQQLIIAYNNSSIDIVKNSSIKNIGDLQRSTIVGNKNIYQIYCNNGLAYLSTGLGIVVLDLKKYETKDTWIIGNNGNQTATFSLTQNNNIFFAATNEGLKTANSNASNLANFSTWQNISGINGLSVGNITNAILCNNKIVVQKHDSLFIENAGNWSLLYAENNWQIENINAAENKIFVAQRSASGGK
jgi:hypothetical protein